MDRLLAPFMFLGARAYRFFVYLGQLAELIWRVFAEAFKPPFGWVDIIVQCEEIGLASMPIASVTLFFVGLVFAFQFGFTLQTMGAVPYIGRVTSLAMVRELAPVFTALVVGGRVGAGIAAEIGSMNVTEQIDAIRALGASPYKKLLIPRVIAGTFMIPLVTLFAGALGMLGALTISYFEFHVNPSSFLHSALNILNLSDFVSGFAKTYFFGFGIALIGCHEGFYCGPGTEGVGRATTRAVVNVSIMVVLLDSLLTRIFAMMPKF